MKKPLVLKVFRNSELVNVQQFTTPQIVLGRGGDVQVTLEDEAISPIHALIEERDGQHFISDLGSRTGTYLNGKRVLESEIPSESEVRLGPFVIQFFIGVPKTLATPVVASPESVKEAEPSEPKFAPVIPEPPKVVEQKQQYTPPPTPPPLPDEDDDTDELVFAPLAAPLTKAPNIPQSKPQGSSKVVEFSKGKTFAPKSVNKDPKELIKPTKGAAAEVLVFWHERAISSNHFFKPGPVIIGGSPKADVFVPVLAPEFRYNFLNLSSQITINLTPDMEGELIHFDHSTSLSDLARQNKLRNAGGHFELDLKQGEMIRISFNGGLVSLIVRYKENTVKPLAAPLFDLSASEITGVVMAVVIASILGLYMAVYAPSDLNADEARIEEPIRKAIVTFKPPPQKVEVVEEPKPPKEPPKVVKVVEKAPTPKPSAKPAEKRQTPNPSVEKAGAPGKAGEVAPSKTPSKSKAVGSARPGGSVKTANKEAANAKSVKPDPMKTGLFSAFGSKGVQSQLDKAYSGSGELQGLADQATGTAGMAENRPGEGLGTKLKEGASGKGESIVGIAGVGTKGRGTGTTGYGSGNIGTKGSVEVNVGGDGAGFTGSIDKEAIRRVIREHKNEIRSCYERELQRRPDLFGKVVFSWVIGERGKVMSAKVTANDLGSADVANCIKNKLQTWTFPEPPPNTLAEVTSFPFVFASQ